VSQPTATPAPDDEQQPYWQFDPCPAWCEETHSDADSVEDRRHVGGTDPIPLTLAEPVVQRTGAGRSDIVWAAPMLSVDIVQGWREVEPQVRLSTDAETVLQLTEAEAHALLDRLSALLSGETRTAVAA
jgi:hypothetical protein